MQTSKQRDFMNVCRVCMIQVQEASAIQTLFQEYPPSLSSSSSSLSTTPSTKYLSDMFTACTEIVLKPNENWPHLICNDCSLKLISAFEFRQQSIASEKEIRMVLGREFISSNVVPSKRIKLETDLTLIRSHSPDIQSFEPKVELKAEDCDIECIPTNELNSFQDDYDDDASEESDYRPGMIKKYEDNEMVNRKVKKHLLDSSKTAYPCDECDQEFKKKRSLSAHMRAHKRERGEESNLNYGDNNCREFPCTECDQVFDRKRSLSSHIRVHNRENGRKYNCESCFESFVNYSLLKKHIRTHNDSGQVFECDICQGKYKFRSRLIQHMDTHHRDDKMVERSFPCSFCDKSKYNVMLNYEN